MEPKCGICDLFNVKYHCNNCKLLHANSSDGEKRAPKHIDCSLEEMIEYVSTHENFSDRFIVGDYKTIELYTGEKVKLVIVDTYKDKLADGSLAPVTFGILVVSGYYEMNEIDTNEGSWRDSLVRNVFLPRIMKLLPPVLIENAALVVKKTSAGDESDEIVETEDKLFLFSEIELFGKTIYSYDGEGEQYEYFEKAENRAFGKCSWLRSPYGDSSGSFCFVGDGGGADWDGADCCYALPFGFCIKSKNLETSAPNGADSSNNTED